MADEQTTPEAENPDAWLEKVPANLHHIAKKYGRPCFDLVMEAGAVQYAVNVIEGSRPPRPVHQAFFVMLNSYNRLFPLAREQLGISQEIFESCQQDVVVAVNISEAANAPGEKKSPGGILLTH